MKSYYDLTIDLIILCCFLDSNSLYIIDRTNRISLQIIIDYNHATIYLNPFIISFLYHWLPFLSLHINLKHLLLSIKSLLLIILF
jgi:hypothetical protein